MKVTAFSVFDRAANAFLPIFFQQTRGLAIRAFSEAVNDPKHQFHRNTGDYILYEMFVFDDGSGLVEQSQPVSIMSAADAALKLVPDEVGSRLA